MQIRYATGHRWYKKIADQSLENFGKNDVARLRSSFPRVVESKIGFEITELSNEFLDLFLPMYEKRILEKENPKIFDIRAKTLGNPANDAKKYYSLSLRQNEQFLGGVIFSIRDGGLFIAYRTLEKNWPGVNLPASPSLYVEFLLDEHAADVGANYIIHGKDRNPYGLNSSIGLANFKLSVGCRPTLPNIYEIETIETDNLTKDTLILECPNVITKNAVITKAYLIADKEGVEKWSSLLKYKDRLSIEVIKRD